MTKFLILVIIMLFFSDFVSKGVAEYKAVRYMEEINSRIPYEVKITRHKVWSKMVWLGSYAVFIDYTANNLRLTSCFEVVGDDVVDAYRVSK